MDQKYRDAYIAKNQAIQQRDAQTHAQITKALDGISNIPVMTPLVKAVTTALKPDKLFHVETDGQHKLEIMNTVKYLPITNQCYRDDELRYTLQINTLNQKHAYTVSLFFMPNEQAYEYTDTNLDAIMHQVNAQVKALSAEYYAAAMQEAKEMGAEAYC